MGGGVSRAGPPRSLPPGVPHLPSRAGHVPLNACVGEFRNLVSDQHPHRTRWSTLENAHAYCPDRAALRSRPAETLRRHRACRVLPDRGARRARPRRDAVRERRLRHVRAARGRVAARAAARPVDPRFDGAPYAPDRAGGAGRARIRRAALPSGLSAVPADVAARHALCDDAARPPRPARAAAGVRRVPGRARRIDLEFAAQAAAAGPRGPAPCITGCPTRCSRPSRT